VAFLESTTNSAFKLCSLQLALTQIAQSLPNGRSDFSAIDVMFAPCELVPLLPLTGYSIETGIGMT
jgi:hypothetical protein